MKNLSIIAIALALLANCLADHSQTNLILAQREELTALQVQCRSRGESLLRLAKAVHWCVVQLCGAEAEEYEIEVWVQPGESIELGPLTPAYPDAPLEEEESGDREEGTGDGEEEEIPPPDVWERDEWPTPVWGGYSNAEVGMRNFFEPQRARRARRINSLRLGALCVENFLRKE